MASQFATLGLRLRHEKSNDELVRRWLEFLQQSAIEAYAREFDVRYDFGERTLVLSVAVQLERGAESVLFAGAVLGYCLARVEARSGGDIEQSFLSLGDGQPLLLPS